MSTFFSRSTGSGLGYQTKSHLGHMQSHSQLYCGPRSPEPMETTVPITVGGYEDQNSLGNTNLVNSYFVGERGRSPEKARTKIMNVRHQDSTITTKDRALSRELKATKQRFGFVANASNTHNTNTGLRKVARQEAGTLKDARMPLGGVESRGGSVGSHDHYQEDSGPVTVMVTVPPHGEVAKIAVERPTVGDVKEFFSQYGDNFFANIRRRETFTAQANYLGHSNVTLNQVKIPVACIRVAPADSPDLELGDDRHLAECDFRVAVSRRTIDFGSHDLFTLDDIDDCRVFLYQNVGEQELNRLTVDTDGQKCSTLHKLIKRKRANACLAMLEDTVRLRKETLNHSPDMETALMAACRNGLSQICLAILERADFGGLNNGEMHFKKDPNFVPRTDVSELKSLEGSVQPDGGFSALDLACMHGLEEVACYICTREDFLEVNNISPGNYTSLMHAVRNDLPKAAVAILKRPDFRVLKARNTQAIECTAYQMAKKRAQRPYKLPQHDPDRKEEILSKCEVFASVCRLMEKHPSFSPDMSNAFTRDK
ncbi:unnamed protein product [Amoebophrya sp. A25]|nr:unnamed protein product [Amoebophrya sp. A25]|eukprot:GSA25T00007276001.1